MEKNKKVEVQDCENGVIFSPYLHLPNQEKSSLDKGKSNEPQEQTSTPSAQIPELEAEVQKARQVLGKKDGQLQEWRVEAQEMKSKREEKRQTLGAAKGKFGR